MDENDSTLPFPTHRGLKPGALTTIQIRIASYIYAEHRGHARAILRQHAADEISDRLDVNLSPRKLREQIAQMVRRGLPIGVTQVAPCGYFWIETEEERIMVRNPLLNMAFSTLVHARGFDKENIVAPLLAQLRAAGFGDDEPQDDNDVIEDGDRVCVDRDGAEWNGVCTSRTVVGGKTIMYAIRLDGDPSGKSTPYLPHLVRRREP